MCYLSSACQFRDVPEDDPDCANHSRHARTVPPFIQPPPWPMRRHVESHAWSPVLSPARPVAVSCCRRARPGGCRRGAQAAAGPPRSGYSGRAWPEVIEWGCAAGLARARELGEGGVDIVLACDTCYIDPVRPPPPAPLPPVPRGPRKHPAHAWLRQRPCQWCHGPATHHMLRFSNGLRVSNLRQSNQHIDVCHRACTVAFHCVGRKFAACHKGPFAGRLVCGDRCVVCGNGCVVCGDRSRLLTASQPVSCVVRGPGRLQHFAVSTMHHQVSAWCVSMMFSTLIARDSDWVCHDIWGIGCRRGRF